MPNSLTQQLLYTDKNIQQVAEQWRRPRELGGFKGLGHFEVKF